MRTLPLLALSVLLCMATGNSVAFKRPSYYGGFYEEQQQQPQDAQLKQFPQKNTEYSFSYNAQIASGLIAPSAEDAADPQQQAVTRIQCQAKIQFASQRHGQLQLQQCRVGQQNEQMSEPEQVQPMSAFEQKEIPADKRQQLQQPCQFSFSEGVIERVQFQDDEEAWAKNIKRAVLNMIQLNLKCNNAQGLRPVDEHQCGDDEQQNGQQSSAQQAQQAKQGKTYTIPETTLEGSCQTTYTITKARGEQQYNVTKSINFKKCQKIADVAYGFQTQQQQSQCAQCHQYWAQQQGGANVQANGEQSLTGAGAEQQQLLPNSEQHPCARCDPKEVKEQELDRSTVIRCQIRGQPKQQYALQRCELLSQYVYRNAKSEIGKHGSAMQTVVAATLQARGAQPIDAAQQIPSLSSSKDETLMFSDEWDVDVKRFYMFGDLEFNGKDKNSPFHQVPKVQQAEQALRKLVQTMQQDKQKGIEAGAPAQLQRLVDMLRMSTQQELKRIEQQTVGASGAQMNTLQKQQAKQLYTDALALCGTHCCVAQLVEKIKEKEISQTKAVQALQALNQLPAPSDAIVTRVEQLCKSEAVHSRPAVKQACWLTFGALVNELCAHKTTKNAQKSANGANIKQSGFSQQNECPLDKKQQYKEAILAEYQNSDCINDKMVALSALGNAGVDLMVGDLEKIIKNPTEARVVRVKAIDALRRLRTQMPRKIQRVLLPIFQNTREHPQVRTAAFAIMMYTQPEPQVVDQAMFSITKEPNKQVLAFAYRTMKMMAKSQSPIEKKIAKHIKSALKLTNVQEEQLRASGKWQVPVYSQKQKEGAFVTFATTISARSQLPVYAHAQLDSHFNEQFQISAIKLYMMQQEAEQWYQQIAKKYNSQQSGKTRAQRQQQQHSSSLRTIAEVLGIKSRRSQQQDNEQQQLYGLQYNQQNSQPFAMLCIRTNDVDMGIFALDEHTVSEQTREMLQGQQKPSLAHLFGQYTQQQQQLNGAMATNLGEKQATIPTSAGVPLHVQNSMPVLANIEGQAKMDTESAQLQSPLGVRLNINGHASARLTHIQKMESWMPFAASGVQSVRSVQINAPLQGELNASPSQGITIKAKLPQQQQKMRLVSAYTLPITYTASVDAKSGLVREPRHIRTIHNPKLDRLQHEVNAIKAPHQFGTSLRIQGHYHRPTQASSYEQFVQLLMATENSLQLIYAPDQDSPREVIVRISSTQFAKSAQRELPDAQLQSFYADEFNSPYECDTEQCTRGECEQCEELAQQRNWDAQELESTQTRKQQLQHFITSYKGNQQQKQYKHSMKLSAQTIGGAREAKAQAEIRTQCDSQLHFCSVKVDAERTPYASGGSSNGQKWVLDAQAQLVMPQTVSSASQLQQQSQLHKQFIGTAQAKWGTGAQKQQISIRVQGTQAHTADARRILQQQQGEQLISSQSLRAFKHRTAFLNKFQLQANYQLKPSAQNAINRGLELLKSKYFWNSQSQLNGLGPQRDGEVSATIVIDQITQQHANVTIKTPMQQVRLQQIQLPCRFRPFALIRQQSAQQTHSLGQLISQISVNSRAQCTADGQKVQTFDGALYTAPLSAHCYSVLAKDCGSDEPQFVVLMKKQQQQQGQSSRRFSPKKLKVITPEEEIECQPKPNSQQLTCKVNGQQVQQQPDNNDDEQYQKQQTVQFNNARKSDVTIQVDGIAVRFNGRKAWLKVSPAYKSTQCGLCGHYDDSNQQEDEWRMADGKIASSASQFHRSYTLQDAQCSQQQLNQFYDEQNDDDDQQMDNYYKQMHQQDDDAEDEMSQDGQDDEAQDWNNEHFDGQFVRESRSNKKFESYEDEEEEQDADNNPFNNFVAELQQQQKGGRQCCCCCADDDVQCQQTCQRGGKKCRKQCSEDKKCPNGQSPSPTSPWDNKPCCCCCAKTCAQKCPSGDEQCKKRCEQRCKQNCSRSSDCKKKCDDNQCPRKYMSDDYVSQAVQPVWKTKVLEQNHALCFSSQPVKQCPRGSFPAGRSATSDYGSDSSSSQQQQDDEFDADSDASFAAAVVVKTKKVRFVCLDRSDPEARRLQRQLRAGQRVVDVSDRDASFTEQVREPQQCVRRRF